MPEMWSQNGFQGQGQSKTATKTTDHAYDRIIKALTKVLEQNHPDKGSSLDADNDDADNDTPAPKALQCKKC